MRFCFGNYIVDCPWSSISALLAVSLVRIYVIIVEDGAARRLTRSEGGLTRTARGVTCWRGHCPFSRPVLSSFLVSMSFSASFEYELVNTGFTGGGRILLFYVLS
jgi:hypothetical protein